MPEVSVHFCLPIPNGSAITFTQWLPNDQTNPRISDEDSEVLLRFPRDKAFYGCGIREEDIPKNQNIWVNFIEVEFLKKGVSQEFVNFLLLGHREQHLSDDVGLKAETIKLAKEAQVKAVTCINKLFDFARIFCQQYYLEDLTAARNGNEVVAFFLQYPALVRCEGKESVFLPASNEPTVAVMQDKSLFIREEDWSRAQEIIKADRTRLSLLGTTIANSKQLLDKGYRRSSLIEAVTALEIAISGYLDALDEKVLPEWLRGRTNIEGVKGLFERLGLRGVFLIGLPLLENEDTISGQALERCRRAIDQRNNIVHNGQRDVDENKCREYIRCIEAVCFVLGRNWDEVSRRFSPPQDVLTS